MKRQRALVGSVFALGATVVVVSAWSLWGKPTQYHQHWLLLAALTWLAGPLALRVPGSPLTLTISESLSFVLAIAYGGGPAVVTVAVDGLLATLRMRSRRVDRALFNLAEPALSMGACVLVLDWASGLSADGRLGSSLARLIVPGFAAAFTYLLLNSGLTAVAVAMETGSPFRKVWRSHVRWAALDCFGGTSLALLIVTSARDVGFAGLLTALPLMGALYLTYRTSIRRTEDTVQHLEQVNKLYLATVESLAMAIDAKDQVTHGHIKRVRTWVGALAEALQIRDGSQLKALEAAALLHDIGKLAVPDHILNKPGPLTAAEYEQLKLHTVVGAEILSAVEFPYAVVPIVRHHHENWDGTGYPDGFAGESIPLGARILAVIDCYDALTSDRPYRRALSHEESLAIVQGRRGTMYDPVVVDAFTRMTASLAQPSPSAAETGAAGLAVPAPPARGLQLTAALSLAKTLEEPDLRRLVRLGETLAEHLAPDALLSVVAPQLTRITPATLVAVFVPGRTGEILELQCALGAEAQSLDALKPRFGRGLSGWVAAHKTTIVNADSALEFWGTPAPHAMPNRALSVPIGLKGPLLGVLTLYARERGFTERDQVLVERVVQAIAPSFYRLAASGRAQSSCVSSPEPELPDFTVLERLLEAEGRLGRPLFQSLGVFYVESDPHAGTDVAADVARAVYEAGRPADVVFRLGPTRALVLMPEHEREGDARLLEYLSRGSTPDGSTSGCRRVGFAGAPEDGESTEALTRTAEQRAVDGHCETAPSQPPPVNEGRVAS